MEMLDLRTKLPRHAAFKAALLLLPKGASVEASSRQHGCTGGRCPNHHWGRLRGTRVQPGLDCYTWPGPEARTRRQQRRKGVYCLKPYEAFASAFCHGSSQT
ncbi:UNVERIFIED_CONTAM: hypothetical protein K2H54_029093 [Gekko kuhli]